MPVTPPATKASRSRRSRGRCSTWPRRSSRTAWSGRWAQAERLQLYDHRAIADVIARSNGHRGTAVLTTATSRQNPKWTRSDLEAWFLALVRDAGLPEPLVNFALTAPDHPRLEVDFYWPTHHLIVELDGWDTHHTRAAFEQDRRRDAALTAARRRVVRFTWHEPRETIQRRLQALLHH
jgi:hypothetical protein